MSRTKNLMNPILADIDILAVLKDARLFSQFSDNQLKQLISFSSVDSYNAGQTIIEQGVKNDKIFILLNGHVSIHTDDEFILNLRRQGDLVGEISVITKQPTTAKVIADTAVDLFTIPSDNINQSGQIELKSTLYKLFLDILTEKLTMTTKQVIGYQATTEELIVKKQELAKSEDEIQLKEAILQQVLSSMSDGVVVMASEGHVLHANRAFKEIVGNIEIPDDIGRWPEELGFYKPDEKTLYSPEQLPMTTVFKGKPVDSEEILIRNKHLPEGVWLQASSRMLKSDENNEPQSAVVVLRDFTKKKLEEKALIKAKENAEATAKAKSDFLAVMSHELRTPLNGIMGMTDLIFGTDLNVEQKDYLNSIKTSSENLLSLIRNILDFSNLESAGRNLRTEPFSIKECVDEITTTYSVTAKKKGIELKSSVSSHVPTKMIGNRRGIMQILRNLTENAIKFSERGEIKVNVAKKSQDKRFVELVIAVEDMGIGISKEHLPNLFLPFSQLDSSYSRSFDGAGIGLSLCKKYVDKMNGEIRVESEVGKGSKFEVILSLRSSSLEKQPVDTAPTTATTSKLDKEFSQKHPLNILVAEDNAMNQKLIKKILEKLGYTPRIVNNGLEAVEATRLESFDLVFMDLQMPKMDGIEASRIIIDEMNSPEKPKIVALTANVSEEIKETCLTAGMSDYTTKPLKINHLVTLLEKLHL